MYATVIAGQLKFYPHVASLEDMQKAVGGYVETVMRDKSPNRRDVTLNVYANEEGLLLNLPFGLLAMPMGQPIAGDVVITATDERTGDCIPANLSEMQAICDRLTDMSYNPVCIGDQVTAAYKTYNLENA